MLDATQLMGKEVSFCQPMAEREGIEVAIIIHRIAMIILSEDYIKTENKPDTNNVWGNLTEHTFFTPMSNIMSYDRLNSILGDLERREIIKRIDNFIAWDNGILDIDLEETYVSRK